jgi:hypothetical protein
MEPTSPTVAGEEVVAQVLLDVQGLEARRFRRIPCQLPTRLVPDGAATPALEGVADDVALGGLRFRAEDGGAPSPGVPVHLTLSLPGGGALEARGEVCRAEDGRTLGIRFTHLDPGPLAALCALLRAAESAADAGQPLAAP